MSLQLPCTIAVLLVGGFITSQLSFISPSMVASQTPPASRVTQSPATEIQAGFKQERELSGGEKHTYLLGFKANDFVKLVVEQKGIDVVVRLLGPDGKVNQERDSRNGNQGLEPLSLIVEQAGTYILEVVAVEKTAKAGKYELNLEARHSATDQESGHA